jgi:predicted DNA binding protein
LRRLVIEGNVHDLIRVTNKLYLGAVDYLEVLSFLSEDPKDYAVICRVKFKDSKASVENVFPRSEGRFQTLERGKDGSYTFYYRGNRTREPIIREFAKSGGFLSAPYEIRDGRVKLTFIGNAKEVGLFLGYIQKLGVEYTVLSLTDATFSLDSPLSRLTDQQRKVLTMAFNLGYYCLPRKIDSDGLAKKLGIRDSTFIIHRRKAESQILTELFKES